MKTPLLRSGMSLLEVMISLALTTMIAGLVGGLMRWYVVNQTRADNTFEELRLARTILSMIADDLRCTVREEPFDVQPLVKLLQQSAAGQAAAAMAGISGGQSSGQGASTGSGSAPGASGTGSMSTGSMASVATDAENGLVSGSTEQTSASLPPGIIGSATTMEVDISRPPRVDESIVQQPDIMAGTLTDLPTDIKTVAYYVQGNQLNGVSDSFSALSTDVLGADSSTLSSSGLVRRIVARNVLQKAYVDGDTDRIMRTGTLIAREVVGLDFQYYDGTQWVQTWDSSTQGLPLVVKITIAMQNPSTPMESRLVPPLNLSSMSGTNLTDSGVTVYSTLVNIPGAALAASNQASQTADDGSAELGL